MLIKTNSNKRTWKGENLLIYTFSRSFVLISIFVYLLFNLLCNHSTEDDGSSVETCLVNLKNWSFSLKSLCVCCYLDLLEMLSLQFIEKPRARTSPGFFGHFWKCSKMAEFWHVGFVLPEKHCSEVFFSLGCSLFLRNNLCKKGTQVGKTEWFIAYAISWKWSEL